MQRREKGQKKINQAKGIIEKRRKVTLYKEKVSRKRRRRGKEKRQKAEGKRKREND